MPVQVALYARGERHPHSRSGSFGVRNVEVFCAWDREIVLGDFCTFWSFLRKHSRDNPQVSTCQTEAWNQKFRPETWLDRPLQDENQSRWKLSEQLQHDSQLKHSRARLDAEKPLEISRFFLPLEVFSTSRSTATKLPSKCRGGEEGKNLWIIIFIKVTACFPPLSSIIKRDFSSSGKNW